jgi:hypothetical protein
MAWSSVVNLFLFKFCVPRFRRLYHNCDLQGWPATFGVDLDAANLVFHSTLIIASPTYACEPITDPAVKSRIAIVLRGNCMFVEKVFRSWLFVYSCFVCFVTSWCC